MQALIHKHRFKKILRTIFYTSTVILFWQRDQQHTLVLAKLVIDTCKNETRLLSLILHKTQLQYIKYFNVRFGTPNLMEEEVGNIHELIGTGKEQLFTANRCSHYGYQCGDSSQS